MDLAYLRDCIASAERGVFFGGAGVSTASGIPDFRSAAGLYSEELDGPRPEELLHVKTLTAFPERFYAYYRTHMLYPDARPNDAHLALAELEARGNLSAVITQNIDGLHTAAGSRRVVELHGSAHRYHCMRCHRPYPESTVYDAIGAPHCPACGGLIRPDVVLYGEGLGRPLEEAIEIVSEADLLIVGGTSLTVYPAASLLDYFSGEHLFIVNLSQTPYDGIAEEVINAPVDEVLSSVTWG